MGGESKRYPLNKLISLDLVIDTSAYAAGDQIGDSAIEIPRAKMLEDQDSVILRSILIVDAADQKATIDLLFFSASPTVAGSDNDAANIVTSELDDKLIGAVEICASCYVSLGGSSNALGLLSNLYVPMQLAPRGTSIWVLPVIRTAATYTATTDLKIKLGFSEE